jgi:hypothetical protein
MELPTTASGGPDAAKEDPRAAAAAAWGPVHIIPRLSLHPNPGDIQMNFQILGGLPPPMQTPPKLPMGGCGGSGRRQPPRNQKDHLNTKQTNKQTNSQTQTHTQTNKRTHKQTNTHTTNKQTNAHTKTRHTTKPSGPLPSKRPGTSTSHAGLRQILRFSNPRRPLIGFSPN